MRVGKLTTEHINTLASLSRPLKSTDNIEPCCLYDMFFCSAASFLLSYTELSRFATKLEVQACNTDRLNALPGPSVTYEGMDYRGIDVFGNIMDLEDAKALLENEVVLSEVTVKVRILVHIESIISLG